MSEYLANAIVMSRLGFRRAACVEEARIAYLRGQYLKMFRTAFARGSKSISNSIQQVKSIFHISLCIGSCICAAHSVAIFLELHVSLIVRIVDGL